MPLPVPCYTGRWSVEAMRGSVLETPLPVPPQCAASPQAGGWGQCAVSPPVPAPPAVVWCVVLHLTAASRLAAGEGAPLVLCRLLRPTRKRPPSTHRPLHTSHLVLLLFIKVSSHIALYPIHSFAQSAFYTLLPGRPVQMNIISASLGSIQPSCN